MVDKDSELFSIGHQDYKRGSIGKENGNGSIFLVTGEGKINLIFENRTEALFSQLSSPTWDTETLFEAPSDTFM